MSFFKLTHPPYKTDQEFNRRNPVIETSYGHIPGIVCPVCGVWLSSDRLRVSWSARVEKVARTNYQAPDEWSRSRTTWARLLRVEPEVVTPGATLGPPSGRCTAAIEEEVVHPFPGLVWITRRVRNVFTRAKLTGLSFAKVQLQPKRWQRDVWELVVRGRAWRKGSTAKTLRACNVCGRMKFPSPTKLDVDVRRWDRSDFFHVDHNPNIVLVTERVASVIEEHGFTNLVPWRPGSRNDGRAAPHHRILASAAHNDDTIIVSGRRHRFRLRRRAPAAILARSMHAETNIVARLLAEMPVVLAPMELITDAAFRRVCRSVGASMCVTEFVGAEQMIADSRLARQRAALADDDRPTAIQIYGSDADLLLEAARVAEHAQPAFIDLNCGCWIPKIAGRGAGAGWLRDPAAMVEMARRVSAAVSLPVTVKTRIGWGPESHMPIVDLARRLEDAGVHAITIHCRTAAMGHHGPADWTWAARAREVVSIPVIVNGDVRTADDAVRALAQTGCAGVMIGRATVDHPWIFREARAKLAGTPLAPPTDDERRALYRAVIDSAVALRGERAGIAAAKRHIGVLGPLLPALKTRVLRACSIDEAADALAA